MPRATLLLFFNSTAILFVMNLSAFLRTTTQKEFAARLGVSQGLVHQWVKGRTRITAERCIQIERVTGGAVTRHILRPDLFGDDQDSAA